MKRLSPRLCIWIMTCISLSVGTVRAEVVIERLSSLVESAPADASEEPSQGDERNQGVDSPRAPATMIGALSILEESESGSAIPIPAAKAQPLEKGHQPTQLRDLWAMRRLAIRMGNDEAALESERLLEEALEARRSISARSTSEEKELAYVLLLEAAGAEQVGAHSSASNLIHVAGLAAPGLPAVHVARARLAWGGTSDFGDVFDGLVAAAVAVLHNDALVAYAGAALALGVVFACLLALMGVSLATAFSHGRYLLVDLQSRFALPLARWHWGAFLLCIAALPLALGAGPLFTSLSWLTVLGTYLNRAQQRTLRGIALVAPLLPYGAWLAASWLNDATGSGIEPESAGQLLGYQPAEEIYADIASVFFWGMSVWGASLTLLCFPLFWLWGWNKVEEVGLVGACDVCGGATRRDATSASLSKRKRDALVCPLCLVRIQRRSAETEEAESERVALPQQLRASRAVLWFWTLVWPGWGHLLVGQLGRGARYFFAVGLIWFAWGFWASPLPWPEPVLVGERHLVFWLLTTGTVLLYTSAILSCAKHGRGGGMRAN